MRAMADELRDLPAGDVEQMGDFPPWLAAPAPAWSEPLCHRWDVKRGSVEGGECLELVAWDFAFLLCSRGRVAAEDIPGTGRSARTDGQGTVYLCR
jgi:hypothetical protein